METYNKWKHSPTTGKPLYTTSDIAKYYGVSAQQLNDGLVKFGYLLEKDSEHNYYRIANKAYGEECYFDASKHEYVSEPNENTTNITAKFNELGKTKVENLLHNLNLISACDINIDYDELEKFFPEGEWALSIRRPNTTYNPIKNGPTKIYISNRNSRNGSHFNRDYMFISNEDREEIRRDILAWGKEHHYPTKGYQMNLDNSSIATKIILWKDRYFFEILEKAGYTVKLSEDQIKHNKDILKSVI